MQKSTYPAEMCLIMKNVRRLSAGGGVLYEKLRTSVPNWSESTFLEMLKKGFLRKQKFVGGVRVFYTNAGLALR